MHPMQPLDHLCAAECAVKLLTPVHRAALAWMKTRCRALEEDDQTLLAASCSLAPRKRRSPAPHAAGLTTPIAGRTPIKKPEGAGATVTSRTGKEGPAAAIRKPP